MDTGVIEHEDPQVYSQAPTNTIAQQDLMPHLGRSLQTWLMYLEQLNHLIFFWGASAGIIHELQKIRPQISGGGAGCQGRNSTMTVPVRTRLRTETPPTAPQPPPGQVPSMGASRRLRTKQPAPDAYQNNVQNDAGHLAGL